MNDTSDKFLTKYLNNYFVYSYSREEDCIRVYNAFNKYLEFCNLKTINKKANLLDVGSGDGEFVKVLNKKGVNTFGVDGSSGINFEQELNLNYSNNFFDFVVFHAVIEHLKNPNFILKEIYRVLKNDGILITTTLNFRYALKHFYDDPTHIRPYTDVSVKSIMELNNFKTNFVNPLVFDKSLNFLKLPFKYFYAAKLPFNNHSFKNFPIPKVLRGKSTSLICLSKKNLV